MYNKLAFLFLFSCLMTISLVSSFDFPHTIVNIDYTGNLTNLSEMQDVNIPSPSNNQLLQFNSGTNKWTAETVSGLTDTNASTACSGTDYLAGNGSCLSAVGGGSGDITAVTTNGDYLTGGADSGVANLLFNETVLNATIDSRGGGDTWWGLNENYIYNNSNSLDFNETKLNQTIDLRDSDTTYTNSTGLSLTGNTFSVVLSYFQGLFLQLSGGTITGDLIVEGETNLTNTTITGLSSINNKIKYVQPNQTIQSVIDSITDATADNPYTVMVSPGVYNGQVVMKSHVHIVGYGAKATIIQHEAVGSAYGTIVMANQSSLSRVTVKATGTYGIGFYDAPGEKEFTIRECYVDVSYDFIVTVYPSASEIRIYNTHCKSEWDGIMIGGASQDIKFYLYNSEIEIVSSASATSCSPLFLGGNGGNEINMHGGRLYTENIAHSIATENRVDVATNILRLFNVDVEMINSNDTWSSTGIYTKLGSAEIYGGKINTTGPNIFDLRSGGGNISIYGTKYSTSSGTIEGDIKIPGSLNVTNNITANYFKGDGSLLTGISGGNSSWNETYARTIFYDEESDLTGLLNDNYAPINYGDDWNKTYADTLYADISSSDTNCSVDGSCPLIAYDSEINKTYVDAQDSAQDACSEITGCIENAIIDGNTNWDNSYGLYNNITNFTGTLTNDKICIYDSSQGIINCSYTDQTGSGGNVKSGDGTYTYNDTDKIYFNSTYAGINLEVNGSDYWDALGSPSDINAGDITNDGTYRLNSWDNLTGIPHATPTDGDITHFSLADEIYDWVISLGYLTSAVNIFDQWLNTTSGVTFENMSTKAIYGNGDVDTFINWTGTGGDQLELFAGGMSFIHLIEGAGSGIAFNQDSNDIDWRVESNDHTHALAVDGGTNKVRLENYTSCSALETDASGIISCGTDADTTYSAGNGMALTSTTFSVAGNTALTQDADGLSVTADGIGDTQLEYNTGQHLTTTSNPQFNNVTGLNCLVFSNGAKLCGV